MSRRPPRSTDEGYFPRGESMLRRVHSERAVGLLYGQRALAIGALHPPNFVGTTEHTRAREMPFQRLSRTGEMFETVFFGTRAQADRVLAVVARMHERVNGELPEAAGPFPAGTPYSATDPALMLWTIAVMLDSAECFFELLVRRLTADERGRLWSDYARFGELFGLPRTALPADYDAFRKYYEDRLASAEMHLTDEARRIGYATAFEIPMPRHAQPSKRVHDLVMLGSLPPRVRELYGLPWDRRQAAGFSAAVGLLRAARPLVPPGVRWGGNRRSFAMVAATERRRIKRGEPTTQLAV